MIPDPVHNLRRRLLAKLGHRHGLPLREGNAALLLEGGGAWLEATGALIRGARASLDFEMYIWADDPVGRSIAGLLKEALGRGVRVRGLVDALGSFGSDELLEDLRGAGAELLRFHPVAPWRPLRVWNRRNHRKLLVADGVEAVTGSANWGQDYDGLGNASAYLDIGLGLRGPSVSDLAEDFEKLWRRCGGEPRRPSEPGVRSPEPLQPGPWIEPVTVQVVTSLSRRGGRAIRRHLDLLIRQARHSLWIANAYFVPGPRLLRLLVRAARRGTDLRLLLPGPSDNRFVQAASRAVYAPLLKAGARISERRGRVLHAKAALVDEAWVVIGSANLDPRSFRHNLELNLALHHPALTAQVRRLFEALSAESDPVDAESWARRPWPARLWSWIAYRCRWWL